jgi:hypothetical protein
VQAKESLFLRTDSVLTCHTGRILSIFFAGTLLGDYVLDSCSMCMLGRLVCSSVAQPGAHEQNVILLGQDQLANLHFL